MRESALAHCADVLRAGDRERWLVTLWLPVAQRPAVTALFALDRTLARVVETTTEPMIGRIRLAWWREALERLDHAPPPGEPVLAALAAHVLPFVTGSALSRLEEAHLARLEGEAGEDRLGGPLAALPGGARAGLALGRLAATRARGVGRQLVIARTMLRL